MSSGNTFGAGRGWAKKREHPAGDRLAEDRLAARHRPDRAGQLLLVGVLEHVAAGAGAQRGKTESSSSNRSARAPATSGSAPTIAAGRLDAADARAAAGPSGRRPAAARPPARPPPRPSTPTPATTTSGTASSSATTPLRNSGWSSTTSTRTGSTVTPLPRGRPGDAPACRRRRPASTRQSPPISAARSRIDGEPDPGAPRSPGSPRPSSVTSTVSVAGVHGQPHAGRCARRRAGRRWSAPPARCGRRPPRPRRAAAAGPAGTSTVDRGPRRRPPMRSASRCSAPTRPELVQRRRPQLVDQPADVGDRRRAARSRSSPTQRLGRRRVAGDQALAARRSARSARPAAAPSPSCRSRRSRRRSSSRAVTSRSRERCRSAVSRDGGDGDARLPGEVGRAAAGRRRRTRPRPGAGRAPGRRPARRGGAAAA